MADYEGRYICQRQSVISTCRFRALAVERRFRVLGVQAPGIPEPTTLLLMDTALAGLGSERARTDKPKDS